MSHVIGMSKWDWRKHLTPDERYTIAIQDRAIEKHRTILNAIAKVRAPMVNRALQRARYEAGER